MIGAKLLIEWDAFDKISCLRLEKTKLTFLFFCNRQKTWIKLLMRRTF